jgi:hypothetical protein
LVDFLLSSGILISAAKVDLPLNVMINNMLSLFTHQLQTGGFINIERFINTSFCLNHDLPDLWIKGLLSG